MEQRFRSDLNPPDAKTKLKEMFRKGLTKPTTILNARAKLASALPSTTEILRGSLLHRRIRHRSGCAVCARGKGHLGVDRQLSALSAQTLARSPGADRSGFGVRRT